MNGKYMLNILIFLFFFFDKIRIQIKHNLIFFVYQTFLTLKY